MRWSWQPKHTFRSGLLRIIEGLENGSVILPPRQEAAKPKAVAPADLVITLSDLISGIYRKDARVWLVRLSMSLGGIALLIGGIAWHSWPIIVMSGILLIASYGPVRIWQKVHDERIQAEMLVALLELIPDEKRPLLVLRLFPRFKEDLEKAGVQVNSILQHANGPSKGVRELRP